MEDISEIRKRAFESFAGDGRGEEAVKRKLGFLRGTVLYNEEEWKMPWLNGHNQPVPPGELIRRGREEEARRKFEEEVAIEVAKRQGLIDGNGNSTAPDPEDIADESMAHPLDVEDTRIDRCPALLPIVVRDQEVEARCAGRPGHPGAHRIVIEFTGEG